MATSPVNKIGKTGGVWGNLIQKKVLNIFLVISFKNLAHSTRKIENETSAPNFLHRPLKIAK